MENAKYFLLYLPNIIAKVYNAHMQLHSQKLRIRNKKFYDEIRGIKKEKILGVAVDWSKSFHKVMVFDFSGKILVKPFEIDTLRKGYDKLLKAVQKQERKIKAKKIFVVIEPSGSWAYSLILNLGKDFEELWLVNPYQTASNRKEKMIIGLKTDDIDLCSLADLLIRGECYKYVKEKEIYTQLKIRTYWRHNKIEMRTRLLNQICQRLGKVYPSVSVMQTGFRKVFDTAAFKCLMHLDKTPTEVLALGKERLKNILPTKAINVRSRHASTIMTAFSKYLSPDDNIVKIELEILKKDIRIYEAIEAEIKVIEDEMTKLVNYTEGKYLLNQISGITDIMIASYIGIIGSVNKYENAKKIFSLSGLAPKIKESGGKAIKGMGMIRKGNKYLGTLLFKMARCAIFNEPYFYAHFIKMRKKKNKPYRKSIASVAKKINNTLFAIIRDKKPFSAPAISAG